MQLIGNARLITRNKSRPYLDGGCVAVEGTRIVDFGTDTEMKTKHPEADFFDAEGKVVMPGLINTHMHIYSAFARGMSIKNSPVNKDFSMILENLWWRVDKTLNLQDVQYSAYATLTDCIKNGVTTVFDHHASQNHIEGSLFVIADVAKALGIRVCLAYEVTDRDGAIACEKGIRENLDFIKFARKQNCGMVDGMFGLHASLTLSDKTLEKCVCAIEGLDAGFHIHTAEGIADVSDSLEKHQKRVVNRLFDEKILGCKSICVHCVHVSQAEIELLACTDTLVVHNPESNMGNAVGCAPALQMLKNGVNLGLGTDGYTSDMFESLKIANLIHKHHLGDPSVAWDEVHRMLFDNNRQITRRFFMGEDLGVIAPGAIADIIVIDYIPPTPMDETNINGHILFGIMGGGVSSTMINGRFVYKNRQLLTADEKQIFVRSQEQAADFWKRINV